MEFEVRLEQDNYIDYLFEEGACEPVEETLVSIHGTVSVDGEKIGWFLGYELDNDENFYRICDEISGDCGVIATAICKKSRAVGKKYLTEDADFEKLFLLDHIELDREYRYKGIGSDIMKNLPEMLCYQFECGSNIFLCASDFESARAYGFDSAEYRKGCRKLILFYEKFGYRVVKGNVMVSHGLR